MRERYYSFKSSDGAIEILTLAQASASPDPVIKERLQEIIHNLQNVKRVRDGFQSGFQENLGIHCGDRKQYDTALRERGLIEIGNESINWSSEGKHSCANEGFIKALIEEGGSVEGEEAEAIISGEFFKDETIV